MSNLYINIVQLILGICTLNMLSVVAADIAN